MKSCTKMLIVVAIIAVALVALFIGTRKNSPAVPVSQTVGLGARCGGNMMNAPICSTGYHCAPVPGTRLPFGDVGGTCVAD